MKIKLSKQYIKALEKINMDFFNEPELSFVIENLIEEYLFRENGRLGIIIEGEYEK